MYLISPYLKIRFSQDLYFDSKLTTAIRRPIIPGEKVFIGIELMHIQSQSVVIALDRLWVTASPDPGDPDMLSLLRNSNNL